MAVSRPVRAVAGALGGWTAMRAAMLWPVAATIVGHMPDAAPEDRAAAPPVVHDDVRRQSTPAHGIAVARSRAASLADGGPGAHGPAVAVSHIATVLDEPAPPTPSTRAAPAMPRAVPQLWRASDPSAAAAIWRPAGFSGSVWALSRESGGTALAGGGQLGGSQVGARFFFRPAASPVALTGRISAPLGSPRGREISTGIALRWRGVGALLEQRFALDRGGRDAPSVTVYGGVSEVRLAAGVRLDGYAQAGIVGVRHPAAFVDGALRMERTLLERGRSRLSAGFAVSGGAQPDVARLDIGPQLVARLPVGDTTVRITGEWRQRIAGNVAPGSGPAVTLGFDF